MRSKIVVVGLTPDYYSASVSSALKQCRLTMRSTNMGASFITRSIASMFDADYVDFTSNVSVSDLRNKYHVCIVSLASHLGPARDIEPLVSFVKRLDIRTVFLSGGLDAGAAACMDQKANSSVRELLDICSADGQWIGVRGALSAFYLHRHGIESVAPIGCPTMYSRPPRKIGVPGPGATFGIAIPFHWTIAAASFKHLDEHPLIGQDCSDEELFVEKRQGAVTKRVSECLGISRREAFRVLADAVRKNGRFPNSYTDWYQGIGRQAALLSGRLHAAICGLTQGVPSVLVPWDLRTQELVDYFALPNVSAWTVQKKGARASFLTADFDTYNNKQPLFWGRWYEFLENNNLACHLSEEALNEHKEKRSPGTLDNGQCLLSTAALSCYLPNTVTSRSFSNTVCLKPRPSRRLVTVLRFFLEKFVIRFKRLKKRWDTY